ncbi:organic cation transporter protein [Tribolium castaneum]|uniref:Organic cation transporter protein-like Protein n=1 Tax=Tribolium castaneum TaxID=7070 RepID=D6WKJ0_TRICA|nr:PREDICTED: organic cation transporter protein isoform X2 [Tribolium castaneum]XP_015835505.1 PREDICTED: organic cation transporter protein isoform X1 [Tribolium castaneum]XP_973659.1 PREDICTED: organic cation transporter protein isoform X1 [Tribolium castaneum]EFA04006.1 Organic cation transporter protein-like Protein [Tribolium castaneum]|eukprot:XP_015835504.1 PREDICTED: organic cation transporter protein isoform X2 [Tribolium castaneum]
MSEKDATNSDIIQKSIGVFGRWHVAVCFIIFLVKFPVAWHQLSIVFLAPPMKFSCIDNDTDKCSSNCSEHIFDRTIFAETIITQWDLVCGRTHLASLAQTVTMFGILSGNMLFGYLSDRFGRRGPLTGAVILQVVSGTCTAFAPYFPLFLFMRFLAALSTGGTMVISFVLVMELVGLEWRTTLGILYQIPFNLGHLLLPLFAYFLRDWRYFQITISLPAVILISYYWILPESPRWLLTVGKKDKAIKLLEKAAHYNKLPTEHIKEDVYNYMQKNEINEEKQAGNILDLVKTPIMRMYTFCVGFNWFVCGLCFFGSAQYIGQLGGNIFINVALSAVIQIPSTLFSIWAVKAWGRKRTLISSNILAGISCLLIAIVPGKLAWVRTTLSCVDMFALAVSFPTVYIYSGELFPTVVRNIGVGTSSMCARFGSMAAPFIAGLVIVQAWLPPVIFGVVPLIGALLCIKLPETLNCTLPDTVEEAEQFVKKALANNDTEMR